MDPSHIWIEKIVEALEELDGGGSLNDIYAKIIEKNLIDTNTRPYWQGSVRRTILMHSSDANIFHKNRATKGKEAYDILYAPKGLHAGYWALRKEYRNARARESKREKVLLAEQISRIKVFYVYDPEDKSYLNELEKQLAFLKRKGYITTWNEQEISVGSIRDKEVEEQLKSAFVILLLISSDFLNSDACYEIMNRAIERHNRGLARVIPILLRPVDYGDLPFSKIGFLPANKVPVVSWGERHEEAFLDIAQGIKKAVYELLSAQWVGKGEISYERQHYDTALSSYNQAIDFDSSNDNAHIGKSNSLNALGRYVEALEACHISISLGGKLGQKYLLKGDILSKLKRYIDALAAYNQATKLGFEFAYLSKGSMLIQLERFEEALDTYECASEISILPKLDIYLGKGHSLYGLGRYEEALIAYEYVIKTFQVGANVHKSKGDTLYSLHQYEKALETYEHAIMLDSKCSILHEAKGNALFSLNRFSEALNSYEQAIQWDGLNANAFKGKGKVFEQLASEAFAFATHLDKTRNTIINADN